MKKRLLLLIIGLLNTIWAMAQFSGSGSGTENDPYLILNPIHLNQMRNYLNQSGVYFKLMANINVEEFIGIKSYKAKGKRLSTREIESFQFLEPFQPEPTEEETEEPEATELAEEPENVDKIEVNPADVPLEIVETKGDGVQMNLFDNDNV